MRAHRGSAACLAKWAGLSLLAAMAAAASAEPAGWQTLSQPGGYRVARIAATASAPGMALTCEGKVPVLALSLASPPRRNPAQLTLVYGSATANLGIQRNGTTNVWAAALRDSRVVDMLARVPVVMVAVDGAPIGTVQMTGAGDAMRATLAGCWTPSATAAVAAPAPPTAVAPSAATATPAPDLAKPIDVTAAGFPFKTGTYIWKGRCTTDNEESYEYAKRYRHEFGADQQEDFIKIVKYSDNHYKITEKVQADEKVDDWTGVVDYRRTDPDSFVTDEPLIDYTPEGKEIPRGPTTTYRWCPPGSVGG